MDSGKMRFGVQAAATLLQNAHFKGFFTGKIYKGPLKQVCVPGLNCYSCPGAVGACPVGSLQSFLGGMRFRFPYYVLGLLIFFGALLGRLVCGFLCPCGWLQELVYLIPSPKKNRFPGDRPLRWLKYAVLAALVVILPLSVKLTPFFCKYLCPSGTVSGLMLFMADGSLAAQWGALFNWKLAVLLVLAAAGIFVWRPFCKYLCPLGAFYGLFNRFALVRMDLDAGKCVGCGKCAHACRMCVDPAKEPNSAECVRCGKCVAACPEGALRIGVPKKAPGDKKTQKRVP